MPSTWSLPYKRNLIDCHHKQNDGGIRLNGILINSTLENWYSSLICGGVSVLVLTALGNTVAIRIETFFCRKYVDIYGTEFYNKL